MHNGDILKYKEDIYLFLFIKPSAISFEKEQHTDTGI